MFLKTPLHLFILLSLVFFFLPASYAADTSTDPAPGIDLIQNGSFKEGLAILEEYVKSNSTNPEAWNSIGYALNNLGRFRDAIPPLENATRLEPNHTIAWTNMGWAYNELGDYEKALEALETATRTGPDNKYAWSTKGYSPSGLIAPK